jgi:hypothetical protein
LILDLDEQIWDDISFLADKGFQCLNPNGDFLFDLPSYMEEYLNSLEKFNSELNRNRRKYERGKTNC